MKRWDVTIENDLGEIWEGITTREALEINDYVRIRLYTRAPRWEQGVVIMVQEIFL